MPAFKPPEAKNAARTLAVMAALLATLFIGITFLAVNFAILPIDFPEKQTVIAQVARAVYGDGIAFYLFQAFTAVLLVLAANTSFNAFPRLLAILAGDGHMPRQFALRGDRLAFSYGIIILASLAAALIVIFKGSTHLLIPLYAVGVFIDFTISQTGMIHPLAARAVPGLAPAPGHQRVRRRPHGRRGGHRDRGQVLRRRVARPPADPDPRRRSCRSSIASTRARPASSRSATRASSRVPIASSASSSRSTGSTAPWSRPSTSGGP